MHVQNAGSLMDLIISICMADPKSDYELASVDAIVYEITKVVFDMMGGLLSLIYMGGLLSLIILRQTSVTAD